MGAATLLAIAVGVTIAVQTATVGGVSRTVHPLATSLALLASGLLVATGWTAARGTWHDVAAVASHWWWLPLGAAGWAIVAALGWTASRLGVAAALSIVIGAQLATGLALDVWRGVVAFGPRPLLAIALILCGVALLTAPG